VRDVLQKVSMNIREFWMLFLPMRERGFLFVSADRFLCGFVLKGAPVNETVVDKAAGFQRLIKLMRLPFRWKNPIFVYTV